jgi:hypothetical protein
MLLVLQFPAEKPQASAYPAGRRVPRFLVDHLVYF